MNEGTSDNKELLRVSNARPNQVPKQSMSTLLPAESKEDDFFELRLKANNRNNRRILNVQDVVKISQVVFITSMYMKRPMMTYDRPFYLTQLDMTSTHSSPI